MSFDKEWEVEATIEIKTLFFVPPRKKRRKKHINIYQNYARTYIPTVVQIATRLRTYIAIQKIVKVSQG